MLLRFGIETSPSGFLIDVDGEAQRFQCESSLNIAVFGADFDAFGRAT